MNMVKSDIAGKPLQDFGQFKIGTSTQGDLFIIPIL